MFCYNRFSAYSDSALKEAIKLVYFLMLSVNFSFITSRSELSFDSFYVIF